MSKQITLFIVALLSISMFAYYATARPEPGLSKSHFEELDGAEKEENCEGVGKEECLTRRTLSAHVDYIYTQKHHP
ncbi:hypothetical protein Ddye_006636 [Dipteronia dyeriana]|uniref:Phytosulfokine n=1 Tax=Dipteronia dyeriana TaxID=168575 RepID=A0AAE0CRD5_9ROSI|nr:hypothetical protein Ddye_006636 [Dipteronia dyeriana]